MDEVIKAWITDTADPRTDTVAALCEIIEAADSRVVGEIKWNGPSYRITDHFATTGLMPRTGTVRLVLHRGAKPRPEEPAPVIDDPDKMLEWKSPDRAVLLFQGEADVRSKRAALTRILGQWIHQTQQPSADPAS